MSIELRVTLKDSERKLTRDYVIYEIITLHESDPIVHQCIKDTKDEFKGEPEDIKINATMWVK